METQKSRAEYFREYDQKNPNQKRERNKRWREKNRDKKKEIDARYRAEHQEALQEYQKNRPNPQKDKETREIYRKNNQDYFNTYQRNYRAKLRLKAIELLGGKCVECGFSDWRAMQIDHINGGGHKERKAAKSPSDYYKNIVASVEQGLNEYQLLCANCNQIKRYIRDENPRKRM